MKTTRQLLSGELNFDIVSPDWIKQQLKDNNTSQRDLAIGVNVDDRQISDWLAARRNPSNAAKAAIWYFFHAISGVSKRYFLFECINADKQKLKK